jgi:Conserved TM helix
MTEPVVVGIEWGQGIEDAWSKIATFVPKFFGFLLVLLIGYFVAKAIAKLADKALERVGFDRALERGGLKRALERSKYDASDLVGKAIFYALMLLVLQLAFGVFGPNPVSDLITGVIAYLPKVAVAIVIIVVAFAIAAAVRELVSSALGGLSYGSMLANLAGTAIVVVGVFAALNQLQIAPEIVNGLFYALLAVVVGSAIVAIGGGGIVPMRQRWEMALTRYDEEKPRMQQELRSRSQLAEREDRAKRAELSNADRDRTAGARSSTTEKS